MRCLPFLFLLFPSIASADVRRLKIHVTSGISLPFGKPSPCPAGTRQAESAAGKSPYVEIRGDEMLIAVGQKAATTTAERRGDWTFGRLVFPHYTLEIGIEDGKKTPGARVTVTIGGCSAVWTGSAEVL